MKRLISMNSSAFFISYLIFLSREQELLFRKNALYFLLLFKLEKYINEFNFI